MKKLLLLSLLISCCVPKNPSYPESIEKSNEKDVPFFQHGWCKIYKIKDETNYVYIGLCDANQTIAITSQPLLKESYE